MRQFRIGDVTEKLGLSADTLRYYEKIGLLPKVVRNAVGIRLYNDQDLSRLKFVQRAQQMNFTLAEIATLLKMREAPRRGRAGVRVLVRRKLDQVEAYLKEAQTLRTELTLLLNLCTGNRRGCGILREMDKRR